MNVIDYAEIKKIIKIAIKEAFKEMEEEKKQKELEQNEKELNMFFNIFTEFVKLKE